jgi:hypothetical protein
MDSLFLPGQSKQGHPRKAAADELEAIKTLPAAILRKAFNGEI